LNGSGSIMTALLVFSTAALLGCATGPLTHPTTNAPQTFELETDEGTWMITHGRQSASARHQETGVVKRLYAADDPDDYDDEHEYYGFEARLVSVVGTHVTFELSEGGYSEGAAHGFAVHRFSTLDLSLSSTVKDGYRKRAGIPLDWLMYDGLDCGQAMRSDPVDPKLRTFCEGREPELLIETALALNPWLTEVRKDPMNCSYNEGMLKGTSYGFQEIDSGFVTVLLGIGHGCEVARGAFTQVEIRLPIPKRLARDLRLARERGLLARDLRPRNDWQEVE
jgi:hypothetical protein